MNRWLVVGSFSMALAVALGAFGAHALQDQLTPKELEWWQTAQQYQVWHALGLVLIGLLDRGGRALRASAWLFCCGTVVFSGTLYAMALGGPTWLGAITPIGGVSFIAGWLALAWFAKRSE